MSKKVCSRCNKPNDEESKYKTCESCRAYNLNYKSISRKYSVTKNRQRRGVTCGRRHCSQCGCWRHVQDFAVAKWTDPFAREEPKYFRHICRTCERINGRFKNAKASGRAEPYKPRQFNGSPEQRAARRRKLRNEWQRRKLREDPVWAEEYRERQRFYAERKRRQKGVPQRKVVKSSMYQKAPRSELLDIKPFQQWLDRKIEKYGSIEELAKCVDVSPRTIWRWRAGREMEKNGKERIINKIPLNTVDTALTREGNTGLWEIYPELYE